VTRSSASSSPPASSPRACASVDEQSAREFLQRYADEQARDEGRIFGIWLDGALVGGVLFRVFEVPFGNCEIGVWLAPDAQGRGLVNAAARRLIHWALDTRGMSRVEWRVVPDNKRSIAVAERLGMRLDGVLREAYPYQGRRHDVQSLVTAHHRSAVT
jgi:ribosomal-protein-serine acetyltransferase